MLQRFFAIVIISLLVLIILLFLKFVISIRYFILKTDSALQMYKIIKIIYAKQYKFKDKVNIKFGVYKISFTSTQEALQEYEKVIQNALDYYDKLGYITTLDDTFRIKKNELEDILNKIKLDMQRI